MINPQTQAEKLTKINPKRLQAIAEYGCCAFVLLWCLGLEPDDVKAILTLDNMMDSKALDEECLVFWDKAVSYLTGRRCSVIKENITTIKNIKKRTPVRYEYQNKSHWVGVEDGEIKFNSLKRSQCVELGTPKEMRILKINGV